MGNPNNPGDGKFSGDKGVDQGRAKQVKSNLIEAHFSHDMQQAIINHTRLTKNPQLRK